MRSVKVKTSYHGRDIQQIILFPGHGNLNSTPFQKPRLLQAAKSCFWRHSPRVLQYGYTPCFGWISGLWFMRKFLEILIMGERGIGGSQEIPYMFSKLDRHNPPRIPTYPKGHFGPLS